MEIENNNELDLETLDKEDVDIYQSEYTGVEIDAAIRNSLALGSEKDVKDLRQNVDDIKESYINHITTDNPHGITAAQVGARPDTWTPTAAEVGAAPAGYGLGEEKGSTVVADPADVSHIFKHIDTVTENGIYYLYDAFGDIVPTHGTLIVTGNSLYKTQTVISNIGGYIIQRQYTTPNSHVYGEWEYVNPPMKLGVEYRTSEHRNGKAVYKKLDTDGILRYRLDGETEWKTHTRELGAAPESHLSDKNNPHNVTKAQIGLGNVDNTSDKNKPISTKQKAALDLKADKTEVLAGLDTKADIIETQTALDGKAPAGFGLGTNGADINDWNKALYNGFVREYTGTEAGHSPFIGKGSWGYVSTYSNGALVQVAFCNSGYDWKNTMLQKIRVRYSDGPWGEWEWVNPPMLEGVEYRTTERWNGKAVYTTLVDCGLIPSDGSSYSVKAPYECSNVIGVRSTIAKEDKYHMYYSLPITSYPDFYCSAASDVSDGGHLNKLKVNVSATQSSFAGYHLYAQVWYIKKD